MTFDFKHKMFFLREEQIADMAVQFAIAETAWQKTGKAASMRGVMHHAFMAGAEWADAHPHWISVEEELPEEKGEYLVYAPLTNGVAVCVYNNGWKYFGDDVPQDTVTHWCHLPEPPKKGGGQ